MAKKATAKPKAKPAKKKAVPKKVAAPKKPASPKQPASRHITKTTAGGRRRAAAWQKSSEESSSKESLTIRDISIVPPWSSFKPIDFKGINWKRRLACRDDPLLDLQTYLPNVFYLAWASYQKSLICEIEDCIRGGGKKTFGCPRGGGKTGIVRGMILRATKFGLRNFAFFIGSREDKAIQTLDFLRTFWYRSAELQQDFPEIAYPVYRLEGRSSLGAHGQLYKEHRTYVNWSSKEVQYPSLLLTEEDVAGYLKHDPDCVIHLPSRGIDLDRYIINSAGCMIRVAGIDGSIRGEAEIHPVLLSQPRPDLVLLDDVQKDQRSDSPKSCEDLERLIESAVDHLSAPDVNQACLMPCTVIREGDVADVFLDPLCKPDWQGERHGVIVRYPPGMSDEMISDEVDGHPNDQGRLWNEYKEIREQSVRKHGNLSLANAFYTKHRDVMAAGIEISWKERYKQNSPDPDKNEVDAIQSAMNWRFKDLSSFMSEAQNRPRSRKDASSIVLTPAEVAERVTNIPRNELSTQWIDLVAFVDVQDELFFYTVLAFDYDYNGQFVDYGTFPETKSNYFRKQQTGGWSLLTREYYRHAPDKKPAGAYRDRSVPSSARAPFEEKIYLGLKLAIDWLLSREFVVHDEHQTIKQIRALAIDTQWGRASDVVKRFIREYNNQRVIGYTGHAFMPSHKQLEEYTLTSGWLFEHQMHPHVREPKWVRRPRIDGTHYMLADVNRLKTFLMDRLASPLGSKGAITLFHAPPERHHMFADHVAGSEYPEPSTARGLTKDCWQVRPAARMDNDYLDCCSGCLALASACGASIKTAEDVPQAKSPSLREVYQKNRGGAKRHGR